MTGQPPDTRPRYPSDDEPEFELDPVAEQDPHAKPFIEHLEELRSTIIKSVVALTVGVTACFIFTPQILDIIKRPLIQAGVDPAKFLWNPGVIDPFIIQLQIGIFGGFILTLPAILYFLGGFILPALTTKEKGYLMPVFAAGAFLFIGGVLFCYFLLLPVAVTFFIEYSAYLGIEPRWPLNNYVGFVLQMLIAFGISFELPLVILVLNIFGLVSYAQLRDHRRHAAVIIVIFAACITPTSDLFSLALLSLPMYFLYEVCVWITLYRQRRDAKRVT